MPGRRLRAHSRLPPMPNLLERLRLRAAVLDAIREFFAGRGYLAVETPVRIAAPAQELPCPTYG